MLDAFSLGILPLTAYLQVHARHSQFNAWPAFFTTILSSFLAPLFLPLLADAFATIASAFSLYAVLAADACRTHFFAHLVGVSRLGDECKCRGRTSHENKSFEQAHAVPPFVE
jgi:hypothetical protein